MAFNITVISIAVAGICIILLFWYNGVVRHIRELQRMVVDTKLDIESHMMKRYDILMNMLTIANRYMERESSVFGALTEIHKGSNLKELQEQAEIQYVSCKQIETIAKVYAELRSNEAFTTLQKQLNSENEHFTANRSAYNAGVTLYNQTLVTFPTNIVANMINVSPEGLFIIEVS